MHIKTGDLRDDSHADDDPSKKAKYVETNGNKVLSKKGEATEKIKYIEEKDARPVAKSKLKK